MQTRNGYYLDEVRSTIQKEIRRSNEEASFYWGYELYDSGYWRYLVRTLCTVAGEDIGMADPQAMNLCMTAYQYFSQVAKEKGEKKKHKCTACGNIDETKGFYKPHWNELGLLITYLCHSKKNRHVDYITGLVDTKRKQGHRLDVPDYAVDAHTYAGKQRLKKEGKDGDHEFFTKGCKTVNHRYFQPEYEKQVKTTYISLLGYNDISEEPEEL
jgi:replication-associated recombination protein RarA